MCTDYVKCVLFYFRGAKQKKRTVITVVDFTSCYEKRWREGMLTKAYDKEINCRKRIYHKIFVLDGHYYINVNDY